MEKYPKISVVILNYNGLNDTLNCLKSLDKCTYPNLDIILLDNGSPNTDEPKVLEKIQQKNYRFIATGKNLGFAGGCNYGIEIALKEGKSEYVYLLNNDTEVEPDVFERSVEVAENDSKIGIVASKSFYYGKRDTIESAGFDLLDCGDVVARGRGKHSSELNRDEELLGVCGAAMLLRCSMLREIGLLDHEFFLYSEDSDLSLRAVVCGWKCWYAHKSVIYHKVSVSTSKVRNHKFNVMARLNALKAYYYNIPLTVLLLNLPFVLIRAVVLVLASFVFLKWRVAFSFCHAIGSFFYNLPKILKKRKAVMKMRKISAWYILKRQKSFIPTYWNYFVEIIWRGRKSVWE